MTRTQKEKETFSFEHQLKQCRAKNRSENNLSGVSTPRGVSTYIMKKNMCGSPDSIRMKMGHK